MGGLTALAGEGAPRSLLAGLAAAGLAVPFFNRQLADADRVSRRSSVRGDVLGDALLDRTHRIADLEVRLSQLEADRSAERKRADELAAAHPDVSGLLQERDSLQLDVERLAAELREAHAQRAAAEDRCSLLERQLDAVEKSTAALPAAPQPQDMPKILIVDDQPGNLRRQVSQICWTIWPTSGPCLS
ncbi:hypothetical protein SAMN02787144_1004269 [Streptomyces atratus]|uniref:Response regulator receiver domain-containing protein n=1 Tax=Streptomyces atratus TaxID=1893 RepID=A0A1K1YFR1_STRAR|nr:hypothetical protein SAMN02787144_1004269 [Streptomyces atratus]